MYSDVSSCNTYNYGDALYWDARYVQEAESFDWYQRYASLRPFVRRYIPTSSRVLMVGCGNALMSEDMVDDGYENIMNVDISSVAIDLMRRKYEDMPQLNYMEMDVRDMSFFPDESFDAVIDKGTLDSLMCGSDAPISAARMLGEVSRLLKPRGIYMLITYGDPKVRMPHLTRSIYSWNIVLYAILLFIEPGSEIDMFNLRTQHQWKFHVRHIQLVALFCEVTNYVIEDGALRQ
ncbi:EEF1A lysine methyltransferase 4 isoform X2 [Populus alba x Populus x berolinensis]|nr:EEF1A lysine methyltransferase 4 isoform X2 [Populus alba x Populus x berolinensis]